MFLLSFINVKDIILRDSLFDTLHTSHWTM